MSELKAAAVRRRLQALTGQFADDDIEAGMRLLTPCERERLAVLLRRAGESRHPHWLRSLHAFTEALGTLEGP